MIQTNRSPHFRYHALRDCFPGVIRSFNDQDEFVSAGPTDKIGAPYTGQ
nr:hypothetical protein SHINE37_70045 [Rhizobiaceae bacterium]